MKCIRFAAALLVAVSLAAIATAEPQQPTSSPSAAATAALTAEAVQQLLDGEGMGLARSAEMNRYPGPKHVLELKAQLAFTAQQETQVEAIRQQMLAAARPLGRSIVDAERALDKAFSSGGMTEAELSSRLAAIAELQGKLRQAHLGAHLLTQRVLTAEQIGRYYQLRGAHH